MTDIENSDLPRHFPVAPGAQRTLPCDLPAAWHWFAPEHGVLARIAQTLQSRNCHPGRSLVLLPYAQLLRQAQTMWATRFPQGFAPRFETSMNWSTALAPFTPGPTDIRFEAAADTLTVRSLLAHFDPQTQEAAVCYFVDEMSQEDVATRVGLSVPTLRKRLRAFLDRARGHLTRGGGVS